MSEEAMQRPSVIDDAEILLMLPEQQRFIGRIKALSTQQYTTVWMQVEIAAIAVLLEKETISAGRVWQLVLPHYNIASHVSSVPDPNNNPNWLASPLADRALVWEHLTALCTNQELAPIPALPLPYDKRDTLEVTTLLRQALNFHTTYLNLLHDRTDGFVGGKDLLDGLGYNLRHDIEHYLAIQWLGGAHAVGASLHGLPSPGGSFGLDDQPVYVLKALVEALKRDIAEYEGDPADQDTQSHRELLGRVQLWWDFVKGYTYDMVNTHQGRIVVAMLVKHPTLVEDLEAVLTRGRELVNCGLPQLPRGAVGAIARPGIRLPRHQPPR